MATNADSGFRIKSILILFVVITLLYTSYGVFNPNNIDESIQPKNITGYNPDNHTLDDQTLNESYEYDTTEGQSFIDMVFGLGSFLTFGGVGSIWARFFLNIVTTICFVGIGFIIYLFIRDWVPLI